MSTLKVKKGVLGVPSIPLQEPYFKLSCELEGHEDEGYSTLNTDRGVYADQHIQEILFNETERSSLLLSE